MSSSPTKITYAIGVDFSTRALHCAIGDLDTRTPQLVRLEIQDDSTEWQAARVYDLLGALLERMADQGPSLVIIERPWLGANARTVVQLGQVQGAVMTTAYAHGAVCLQVDPSTIRKQIIGQGTARGKGEIKRLVGAWVRAAHGIDVGEDAADAIVIWEYARWVARTSQH